MATPHAEEEDKDGKAQEVRPGFQEKVALAWVTGTAKELVEK